jgi:hypothetical protein
MGILLVAGGFLVAGQLGMVGGAWAVFFPSLPKELTLIIPDTYSSPQAKGPPPQLKKNTHHQWPTHHEP